MHTVPVPDTVATLIVGIGGVRLTIHCLDAAAGIYPRFCVASHADTVEPKPTQIPFVLSTLLTTTLRVCAACCAVTVMAWLVVVAVTQTDEFASMPPHASAMMAAVSGSGSIGRIAAPTAAVLRAMATMLAINK